MSLPSLRYCTQAGGKLNLATMRYYADWAAESGRPFFVMYGQTEATARISYVPPNRLREKLGSIGIAIPGGELSLSDADGEPIREAGVQGEIVFRGPNVMMGYAESAEDLSRGNETGGVLRTGDIGYRDADGYFYITGRLKRFAKLFGNRVNLDDVEAMLRSHQVTGVVTEHEDRLLIGVEGADPVEVSRIVCTELKVHHSAVSVLCLAAIPRNAAGKVLYPELARAFAPQEKPDVGD
jgi:acyl-CoA synthetase (AMP-forming)/AMP-acid ligase II